MTRKIFLILAGVAVWAVLSLQPGPKPPSVALAEPEIFASPIHAGCYLAKNNRCKIHVEPFTINLASGEKLVKFQLIAIQSGTGTQTMIYDFRPDQSNPVPTTGSTFTPSLVAKDFAATCGKSYEISLQGQDTGDTNTFNLGLTGYFTCPTGTYTVFLPIVR